MKWTLVVPGALTPAALAPELNCAVRAPWLSELLLGARSAVDHHEIGPNIGAPHWSWLARKFGVTAQPPVTAPYAWQALGGAFAPGQRHWIAFCDPVHLAVGHDSVLLTDLADAPLREDESDALLSLAGGALRANTPIDRAADSSQTAGPVDLRIEVRRGQWFLLADAPLDLQSAALAAVLGQAAHQRLPTGIDARLWRKLANEIQMLWHSSEVNAAREDRGERTVNALWVHGGGLWTPLPPNPVAELLVEEDSIDAAVLHGWLQATSTTRPTGKAPSVERSPASETLSLCLALSRPFAFQDWESWLRELPAVQDRLQRDLAGARERGAERLDLVLCGTHQVRTLDIPLHASRWKLRLGLQRSRASEMQRWFVEQDQPTVPRFRL